MQYSSDNTLNDNIHIDAHKTLAFGVLSTLIAAVLMMVLSEPALANAVGGQAFQDIYTTLTDWLQGTVGKIIVAAFVAVGLISGIVQQSISGFAVAFGAAIGLNWLPAIIDGVFSHALPL